MRTVRVDPWYRGGTATSTPNQAEAAPSRAARGGAGDHGQGGAVCGVPDEVDPSGPRPLGQAFFARTR